MKETTKQHMGICFLGDLNHGKTTLLSALSYLLASSQRQPLRKYSSETHPATQLLLDRHWQEYTREQTIHLETPYVLDGTKHTYIAYDAPGNINYHRNAYRMMVQCDVAIVVVSLEEGITDGLSQHLLLARTAGIRQYILYWNQCDKLNDFAPDEYIEWLRTMREDWSVQWHRLYPETQRPTEIIGSATQAIEDEERETQSKAGKASIVGLAEALAHCQPKPYDEDGPLRMHIYSRGIIFRGTYIIGKITSGRLRNGELVERENWDQNNLVSYDSQHVVALRVEGERRTEAKAGEHISISLRKTRYDDIRTKATITRPDARRAEDMTTRASIRLHFYEAELFARSTHNRPSARQRPLRSGMSVLFLTGNLRREGRLLLHTTDGTLAPGGQCSAEVAFGQPLSLSPKDRMAICIGHENIGEAVVQKQLACDRDTWLWYQAQREETILYLRELFDSCNKLATWKRLVHFDSRSNCGIAWTTERREHQRFCHEYILSHLRTWRATDPEDENRWDGLWLLAQECWEETPKELGRCLELHASKHHLHFRNWLFGAWPGNETRRGRLVAGHRYTENKTATRWLVTDRHKTIHLTTERGTVTHEFIWCTHDHIEQHVTYQPKKRAEWELPSSDEPQTWVLPYQRMTSARSKAYHQPSS